MHPRLLLLGRRMKQAADAVGLPSKNGYALRRGYATRAIDGGADVFAVKRVMGHADLEELAGYVQETDAAGQTCWQRLVNGHRWQPSTTTRTRGTKRGTEVDNETRPTATTEDVTNAG